MLEYKLRRTLDPWQRHRGIHLLYGSSILLVLIMGAVLAYIMFTTDDALVAWLTQESGAMGTFRLLCSAMTISVLSGCIVWRKDVAHENDVSPKLVEAYRWFAAFILAFASTFGVACSAIFVPRNAPQEIKDASWYWYLGLTLFLPICILACRMLVDFLQIPAYILYKRNIHLPHPERKTTTKRNTYKSAPGQYQRRKAKKVQ